MYSIFFPQVEYGYLTSCTCSKDVNCTWVSCACLRVRRDRDAVGFTAVDIGYLNAGSVGVGEVCVSILARGCHVVSYGTWASYP